MKKTWILACACVLVSIASFGQAPSQPPLAKEALAAILAPAADRGSCTTPAGQQPLAVASVQPGSLAPLGDTIEHACMECDLYGDCIYCCRCATGLTLSACALRCP
jgi:hypothetical protein